MAENPAGRWDFLKGNIGVMILSSGLWDIAFAMTWPFYALYVLELGGSYMDIGLISALGAVAKIAPTLFGGYLTDALGRKRILYTLSFLLAVNELIYAYAPDYRYIYVGAVVGSLLHGFREPAFQSIIFDSTKPESRALSVATLQVTSSLFGLLSPYAVGLLIDDRGILPAMRFAYVFTFAMATVASLMRYRFIEETLENGRSVEKDPRAAVREILSDFVATFRELPVQLWTFLLIDFVITFAWAVGEPYFVTYAKEVVGLSAAQWGLATMLTMALPIVLKLPLARASDRHGRIMFILPCMFLWPIGFLLFAYSWGFQAILAARLLLTLASSIGDPAWEAMFYDYSPKEYRGRFAAIASVSWSLIWGAGNIVGGAIYGGHSKALIFYISAGLLLLGALAAFLKVKEPERRAD
ncbi:MAG: MFS transporter [Candidatus Bathyarchaeota archaeon]|nr:MAG: MFS transporter [Candidatus Bathyarchaeota archaeon]